MHLLMVGLLFLHTFCLHGVSKSKSVPNEWSQQQGTRFRVSDLAEFFEGEVCALYRT